MHSFHQSRGRIAFEVLCSLTVSASCAGAWMQTGATAFLPAALATGLYGFWHLTDLRRGGQPAAAAPSALPVEVQRDPMPKVEMIEPAPLAAIEVAKVPKPKKRNRKKQPDPESAVEPIIAADIEAEPEVTSEFPDRAALEEELHPPIAPLFEATPFAHQQRPTFGRKAG